MAIRNTMRVHKDAKALSRFFPSVEVDENFNFVIVNGVALPVSFNHASTSMLLNLPPSYPVRPPGIGHNSIYLRHGLLKNGSRPAHYFDHNIHCDCGYCDLRKYGWWWYCFKGVPGWDPRFHDLLNIVRMVQLALSE